MNNDEVRLSKMIAKISSQNDVVEKLDAKLKEEKKKFRVLTETDAPSLMDELEYTKITLSNGEEIEVKDEYYLSIPKKNKALVAKWLSKMKLGALVNYEIRLEFGPEDKKRFEQTLKDLSNHNPSADMSMHSGSVKSACKELIADGKEVPFKLLGMNHARCAKIKLPKGK